MGKGLNEGAKSSARHWCTRIMFNKRQHDRFESDVSNLSFNSREVNLFVRANLP